jgi:hypothetical protein
MSASFVEAATERAMQQRSRVRKVLFLDVDGVLHPVDEKRRPFRSSCMEVFKQIMASEAEIVLSSNWREDKYSCGLLERNLRSNLLPKWVDSTSEGGIFNTRWCVHANAAPVCAACPLRVPSRCRSDEILDWLHRHADVTHFVVLDDVDLCYEDPSVTVPDCVLERYRLGARDARPRDRQVLAGNPNLDAHRGVADPRHSILDALISIRNHVSEL